MLSLVFMGFIAQHNVHVFYATVSIKYIFDTPDGEMDLVSHLRKDCIIIIK